MPPSRPQFPRMLGRAVVLECPWCGSRRTFIRSWFARYDRCRTCGIAWRREDGFELGAVTVNTIVTFGAIVVAMTVGFIITVPDIPVLPLVLALFGLALVMPIAIYPFTYTVWLAFDLAVHPPEVAELEAAAAAVANAASEGEVACVADAGVRRPSDQRRRRAT